VIQERFNAPPVRVSCHKAAQIVSHRAEQMPRLEVGSAIDELTEIGKVVDPRNEHPQGGSAPKLGRDPVASEHTTTLHTDLLKSLADACLGSSRNPGVSDDNVVAGEPLGGELLGLAQLLGEVRLRQTGTGIPEMLDLNGGLPGCDALASFPGAEEGSVPTAVIGGQKALYRTLQNFGRYREAQILNCLSALL
jgi:hypothetical protein